MEHGNPKQAYCVDMFKNGFKQGNNAAVTVQQACIRDIYIVIYCLCLELALLCCR